jgi:hypothetical protein
VNKRRRGPRRVSNCGRKGQGERRCVPVETSRPEAGTGKPSQSFLIQIPIGMRKRGREDESLSFYSSE